MSQRLDHWKLGFNQFRFHHAYRTCGASQYIPSCLTAFPTCYFSLCVSTPGKSGVLEVLTLNLISLKEKFDKHRNGARWPRSCLYPVQHHTRRSASVLPGFSSEPCHIVSRLERYSGDSLSEHLDRHMLPCAKRFVGIVPIQHQEYSC